MNEGHNIAIKVTGLVKDFKLPHNRKNSLKSVFVNLFRKPTYEKQKVLKNIDLEINKGEFFGIVGRNGSGKSTLLKILAGVYYPDKGDVQVNGKLTPFIELGVGFNPELTGRENVYLNGALLGFNNKKMDEQYEDIVAFAELEKFMDQKLKNYSSGMQVRLAFSIATRADAPILLLDEVLAVGDVSFQRKCFNYFKQLKRDNKTVVLVTHDMDIVREFCDKAVLINEGKIAFRGTAQDTAREYAKLFSPKVDEATEVPKASKRWGDKSIVFTDIKITKKHGNYVLICSAKAKSSVNDPVFGFVVRSADGKPVLGTNSHIKNKKIKSIKPGETKSIKWTFPDVFSNGKHMIDVAITQSDGATVHDWWESVVSFNATDKDRTPYVISPNIEIDI